MTFGTALTSPGEAARWRRDEQATPPPARSTLNASNTYSGATTVNAGRLVLGSAAGLGNTAITINSSGFFQPQIGTVAGSSSAGTAGATLNLSGGYFDMASDNAPRGLSRSTSRPAMRALP